MRISTLITLVTLCASSGLVTIPAKANDAAKIAGTWMAVHEGNGLVLPHFEVLRLSTNGAADVRVYIRRNDDCEDPGNPGVKCDNPHEHARARFDYEASTAQLRLVNMELTHRPLIGWTPHDAELSRAVFWFGQPQANWRITLQNNVLAASQATEVDGSLLDRSLTSRISIRVTKMLYRVPDSMPDDFFALLGEFGASQLEALCFLKSYANRPDGRFSVFLHDAAVTARRLDEVRRAMSRAPEAEARESALVDALRWFASARHGDSVPLAHAKALRLEQHAIAAYLRAQNVFDHQKLEDVPGLERDGALAACRQSLRK